MPATLSILGLLQADSTLLSPVLDAVAQISDASTAQAVQMAIIAESAELETLFPDPVIFKQILSHYALQRAPIWRKMWISTQQEYSPIHNYDRTEEETISRTGSASGEGHTAQDVRSTGDSGTEASAGRYGYNANSSASPESKSSTDVHSTDTTLTGIDSTSSATSTSDETRTVRAYGNVGVTTTTAMLSEYRQVEMYDWVQTVADDVIGRFCILVY